MNSKIIEKFFNSTVKPSDFKFKWMVYRYKTENLEKVFAEIDSLDLRPTLDAFVDGKIRINCAEAKKVKAKFNELAAKYTSKHYMYGLKRYCQAIDDIVHKIAAVGQKSKRAYKKLLQSSNYAVMLDKSHIEHRFDRRFSSLSAMQKWVDKNNIRLDVYKLWESSKPKSK